MEKDFFINDYPYAVAVYAWDGLRIRPCMTKEEMQQVYKNLSETYINIKAIELKPIEGEPNAD